MEKKPKDTPSSILKGSNPAPGDWVKELFAPIFDFDAIVDAGKNGVGDKEPRIKRAPILDPVAVRGVFERVHQKVVEAERLKLEERQVKKQEEIDKLIDPRKSSIWDTEELETLRKVYKSAKGEISRLEAALKTSQSHNDRLQTELKQERAKTETLCKHLQDAGKANERLVIHRDSLQKEVAVLEVKVAALTDMWHEIEGLKLKAMEELKQAHLDLDLERLTRLKLETELSSKYQDAAREKELAESHLRTQFEIEVNDLRDVVKDLSVELAEEKRKHETSRRGLEHLRLHFSSLPLKDVLPPGAVVKNQVGEVDFITP